MSHKLLFSTFALMVLLVLGSCQSKKNQQETPSPINPKVQEIDDTPDSAMLVRLDNVTKEEITVTTLKTGEKATYSYTNARAAGQIKGTLTKGDTLSIFPDNKTKSITISINTSELRGRWFYDMSQHRGLIFETTGGMSTINALTIAYREWRLQNGKLYIYYVDMQQVADERHQYLVDEADIESLTREHLVLLFRGNRIDCKRQHGVIKFGSK